MLKPEAYSKGELLDGVAGALGMVRGETESRIAALEARIAMLESRTAPGEFDERLKAIEEKTRNFEYCGVFEEGRRYEPGNFCTWKGSLWCCTVRTAQQPGQSNDWRLCAQRGRDGRDADGKRTPTSQRGS